MSNSNEIVRDSLSPELSQLESIMHQWYFIGSDFRMKFPDAYIVVPSRYASDKAWLQSMKDEDVADRLLTIKPNDGRDQIPPEIITYYNDVVKTVSKTFADMKEKIDTNEYHIEALNKATARNGVPKFLEFKTPEIKYFPEEGNFKSDLAKTYQAILDQAAKSMLDATLAERNKISTSLQQEARDLIESVRAEATNMWIEAQGGPDGYNRWDHIYPVFDKNNQLVPLSSVVFCTAMKECRLIVTKLQHANMQKRADERKAQKQETAIRKAALAKAATIPRDEAVKTLERRMDDKIAPLVAGIQDIQAQLQGRLNKNAPIVADSSGAKGQSAPTQKRVQVDSIQKQSAPAGAPDAGTGSGKRKHEDHGIRITFDTNGDRSVQPRIHNPTSDSSNPAAGFPQRNDRGRGRSRGMGHLQRGRNRQTMKYLSHRQQVDTDWDLEALD
jgi:hypothetical protein